MKKFILLILLIGVNCNCGVTCSSTSPYPTGNSNSYTETCASICYDSNSKTLTATCKDVNGNYINPTTLITEASATNINNCDGHLCNSQCDSNNQCSAIVPQQQPYQQEAPFQDPYQDSQLLDNPYVQVAWQFPPDQIPQALLDYLKNNNYSPEKITIFQQGYSEAVQRQAAFEQQQQLQQQLQLSEYSNYADNM